MKGASYCSEVETNGKVGLIGYGRHLFCQFDRWIIVGGKLILFFSFFFEFGVRELNDAVFCLINTSTVLV